MIPVRHPKGPNPNPNFIPNPIPNPNPNDSALYKSTFTYLLTYSKILAMADRPLVENCAVIFAIAQLSCKDLTNVIIAIGCCNYRVKTN